MKENFLPAEVATIAENVSVEKRNEVQSVLNHVFNGVSKMREQLESVVVADKDDKTSMKLAATYRLGVKNIRLDAEKTFDAKRAEVQQAMLSYKTEDALWLKAKQTMQLLTKEIEANAKWKEETAKRYEAEQHELKIQQRIKRVAKFDEHDVYSRSDFEHMSDEAFEIFIAGIETKYNEAKEAEKAAESARIAKAKAEAEEQERIRKENERLKAEAEKARRQAEAEAKERAKAEEIRLQKEAAERAEREEKERKEREAYEAKLKAERDAKAKIEAELKAKAEAEAEAKKQAEAAKQAELNKGDAAKVKDLIADLESLKTKYTFKSAKNQKMYLNVCQLIDRVTNYINQ